jgi:hypothetical protein
MRRQQRNNGEPEAGLACEFGAGAAAKERRVPTLDADYAVDYWHRGEDNACEPLLRPSAGRAVCQILDGVQGGLTVFALTETHFDFETFPL